MSISENIQSIQTDIAKICAEHDCDAAKVHLVAVSKKQSGSRIQEALDAGHRLFGENRVQEAQDHWGARRDQYPDLKLHLIGPLQTNKVKDAVALFDVIETLDREKLARKLSAEMKEQGKDLPCFIQVNTGEEDQKSGIIPKDLPEFLNYSIKECGLNVTGLMCIPPLDDPPAAHFAFLRKLAQENGLEHLSMGMSGDYKQAIPLGASYIRVGTGVFGERDYA